MVGVGARSIGDGVGVGAEGSVDAGFGAGDGAGVCVVAGSGVGGVGSAAIELLLHCSLRLPQRLGSGSCWLLGGCLLFGRYSVVRLLIVVGDSSDTLLSAPVAWVVLL